MSDSYKVVVNGIEISTTDKEFLTRLVMLMAFPQNGALAINLAPETTTTTKNQYKAFLKTKDFEKRKEKYGFNTCVICGKDFVPHYKEQKCCGYQCSGKFVAERKRMKKLAQ